MLSFPTWIYYSYYHFQGLFFFFLLLLLSSDWKIVLSITLQAPLEYLICLSQRCRKTDSNKTQDISCLTHREKHLYPGKGMPVTPSRAHPSLVVHRLLQCTSGQRVLGTFYPSHSKWKSLVTSTFTDNTSLRTPIILVPPIWCPETPETLEL